MNFLQPAVLLALPAIAIPIIIHLINQRRFQTVNWAAMQFLLAANRMSRGYARLRRWLILAARALAIAGLLFAVARPLSSGWLGLAGGGRVDTTIVLLDRSPSMQQIGPAGISKLQSGLAQLTQSLEVLKSNRYVLIDSATGKPHEIDSVDRLGELPETIGVSQSADLPAMLETAEQYIRANRPSRCEIWICSDVRKEDWKADSGRWESLRASIEELPQMIRFHLLAYPETAIANRSLRVDKVRRVRTEDGAAILLSLRILQSNANEGTESIPITLEIDGARSEFTEEITGTQLELKNHLVPIDETRTRGWGRISIPSDASPADNEFYFVYDESAARKTMIVCDAPDAEDKAAIQPLQFATAVSPETEVVCSQESISRDLFIGVSLDDVSLLLWQSALPSESDPEFGMLQDFLDRGGQLVFFPPDVATENSFAGIHWLDWQDSEGTTVTTWVADQDVLSKTRSGAALPVGELKANRYRDIQGDHSALATLDGGSPFLARAMTDQRNVYFCCTTAAPTDSNLASNGVVLYAMLHRALQRGAESLGDTRQLIAGDAVTDDSTGWERIAGNPDAYSNAYGKHAGVYEVNEQLLAINRSEEEDDATVVSDDRMNALFAGLEFDRVDDSVGSGATLVQEIWRLFLILMLVALVLEAALCIPKRITSVHSPRGEGLAA